MSLLLRSLALVLPTLGGEEREYAFVFLHGGKAEQTLKGPEREKASKGHFANMDRLAAEGHLLAAGPLGEPRGVSSHRGLFLFDTETLEQGEAWAATDPGVAAELFRAEVVPLFSETPFEQLIALEQAWLQRERARGVEDAAWAAHSYVLATVDDAVAAEELLEHAPLAAVVACRGELGGEREGEGMWWIDVPSVESAQAIIAAAEDACERSLEWSYHPWYGSKQLLQLRRFQRHPQAPTFLVEPIDGMCRVSVFAESFAKWTDVFGVPILATAKTSDRAVLHAAHLMAEYIDNDEDGHPDWPEALRALHDAGAFLVMAETHRAFEAMDLDFESWEEAGFSLGQDLYGEETCPDGIPHGDGRRFDAALEEVLHLVSHGYGMVDPERFAFELGSDLADAMDVARGGRFERLPRTYPDDAWYTYDDPTCDYGCQAVEYFYWALTTLLGAQAHPHRAAEIRHEWRPATPAAVRATDRAVTALLTDPERRLPRSLPDGDYRVRFDR